MIADSLEVRNVGNGVRRVGDIEKFDRVANPDVVLSFWGTVAIPEKDFQLEVELGKFEDSLNEKDDVLTVSEKLKDYFEDLAILDENDNLGFHQH